MNTETADEDSTAFTMGHVPIKTAEVSQSAQLSAVQSSRVEIGVIKISKVLSVQFCAVQRSQEKR
jgi:hypothetical protein